METQASVAPLDIIHTALIRNVANCFPIIGFTKYIVVLKESQLQSDVDTVKQMLVDEGGTIYRTFTLLKGFAAGMS